MINARIEKIPSLQEQLAWLEPEESMSFTHPPHDPLHHCSWFFFSRFLCVSA